MNRRTRHYVWMLVAAVAGLVYARVSREWDDVVFYSGLAAVVALVVLSGLLWTEFAPDGDLRRRPQS